MSKKKQNNNQNQVINNINHLNLEIDYDKLVDAIVLAKQKEKDNNISEMQEKQKQRLQEIGYKEHKNPIMRWLNKLCICLKILLKPKKYMNEYMGISMVMAMALSFVFKLIEYLLYILSVFLIYVVFKEKLYSWLMVSIFSLVFARLFRMANIEMENSPTEKNYIVSVFSSIVAITALVLASMSYYNNFVR